MPRLAPLEPHLAAILPELVWDTTPERLAELAAKVLAPKPPPRNTMANPAMAFEARIFIGRCPFVIGQGSKKAALRRPSDRVPPPWFQR